MIVSGPDDCARSCEKIALAVVIACGHHRPMEAEQGDVER